MSNVDCSLFWCGLNGFSMSWLAAYQGVYTWDDVRLSFASSSFLALGRSRDVFSARYPVAASKKRSHVTLTHNQPEL